MRKLFIVGILGVGAGSALWMWAYLGMFAGDIQITLNPVSGIVVSLLAFICLCAGVFALGRATGIIPSRVTSKRLKRG